MGISLIYQAIPEGKLLERARHDVEFTGCLGVFDLYAVNSPHLYPLETQEEKEFLEQALVEVQDHPYIWKRRWEIYKQLELRSFWHMVMQKRKFSVNQPDWMNEIDIGIAGEEIVHPEYVGGYGETLWYIPSTSLKRIITALFESVFTAEKREEYLTHSIAQVRDAVELAPDRPRLELFEQFLYPIRTLYAEVAEHQNEGIVITLG